MKPDFHYHQHFHWRWHSHLPEVAAAQNLKMLGLVVFVEQLAWLALVLS